MMNVLRMQALGLLTILGLLAGCADRPRGSPTSRATQPATSQAPKAAPATAPAAPQVPIVYDERLHPARLSASQVSEIMELAVPVCPKGQRVWYIHVMSSRGGPERPYYRVQILYTPHSATARLRKGKRVSLDSFAPPPQPNWGREFLSQFGVHAEALYDYYQVSLLASPFAGKLRVPPKCLWPFAVTGDLSNREIIELVDRTREHLAQDPPEPILSIEPNSGGTVTVTTGTVQGYLAGGGSFVEFRKVSGQYVVVKAGDWRA